MFKFTVKFKGPTESELKRIFEKAATDHLKKKATIPPCPVRVADTNTMPS